MMGDDRPPVYWEDDNLIIRASALGCSCMWELTAAGQGYRLGTLPSSLIKAFADGNELEPIIIQRLKDEYGYIFYSHQSEQMLEIAPHLYVRYHPDGIADPGPQRRVILPSPSTHYPFPHDTQFVIEIKALSNALWQKFVKQGMSNVIDEYPWQLSVMMHESELPGIWVGYNKGNPPDENGKREPCPDEGKLNFEIVLEPPIPYNRIESKARLIKELVTGEDILESGKPCDDPTNWPCRFQHLRPEGESGSGGKEAKATYVVPSERQDEVNRMVRQYIYSKGQLDELAANANRERDSILEIGEDYDQIITDTWVVPIHGKDATTTYIDYEQMIADGIDVEKYRKTKPKSRYINKRNIKRRTDVEDNG